jgi:protein involved in ribonucleotide reduction
MMNKKGVGLNDLYPAVLLVIVIGIALGIGIFVLNETADATSTTAYRVTNESITATLLDNAGGATLAGAATCGSQTFAVYYVINASNSTGGIIAPGNYTYDVDLGRISNISRDRMGTPWNVSYTYVGTADDSATSSCNVLETSSTGIGGLADWIAIIIVVLAASIVLGIVVGSFGKKEGI